MELSRLGTEGRAVHSTFICLLALLSPGFDPAAMVSQSPGLDQITQPSRFRNCLNEAFDHFIRLRGLVNLRKVPGIRDDLDPHRRDPRPQHIKKRG